MWLGESRACVHCGATEDVIDLGEEYESECYPCASSRSQPVPLARGYDPYQEGIESGTAPG